MSKRGSENKKSRDEKFDAIEGTDIVAYKKVLSLKAFEAERRLIEMLNAINTDFL